MRSFLKKHINPMSSEFRLEIYGCRGSTPVSGERYTRYGGATSCVRVTVAGREIILDAGSGLALLGRHLVKRRLRDGQPVHAYFFLSHVHLDHITGLPYFAPNYFEDATIWMMGPRNMRFPSFEATIDNFMAPPFFPVPRYEMGAEFHFSDICEADTVFFLRDQRAPIQLRAGHPRHQAAMPPAASVETRVECLRGYNHPKSGVNIYKIVSGGKTLVYATDTEGFVHGDRRLIEFARGADVLIHDAMYSEERYTAGRAATQGFGHSTIQIATDLANAAGVGKLLLFHHDPANDDDTLDQLEARGKARFAETQMARQGMVLDI
ncbi:MBL fold metallo-hydrolase [Bradymonas sediminis]|uniref:MBL fold metallo-hydrolase n=2 Tax=Bradymonas sediminis TaxID=1548548 RepID=A0A2Z4FK75_9DELT|nr:MBL fold metallo-hydrolase [Bradymonas sediminis]